MGSALTVLPRHVWQHVSIVVDAICAMLNRGTKKNNGVRSWPGCQPGGGAARRRTRKSEGDNSRYDIFVISVATTVAITRRYNSRYSRRYNSRNNSSRHNSRDSSRNWGWAAGGCDIGSSACPDCCQGHNYIGHNYIGCDNGSSACPNCCHN